MTNRNLDTQQSQYFDALDTIEENEEESTDDDLSDLDVSVFQLVHDIGVSKIFEFSNFLLFTKFCFFLDQK